MLEWEPITKNLKLSGGEICVANFIPPANSASLCSHFCVKNLTSA